MRLLRAVLLATIVCWTASGQTYTISTFAGGELPVNIAATSASFSPQAVAVDNEGNLFVSDAAENVVLRLDAKTSILTLVAGNGTAGFSGDNGPAVSSQLNGPQGVTLDVAGNLYIADGGNNAIRKVSNGVITTVAGNGTAGFSGDNGPATSGQLSTPFGVAVDSAGNLYIADRDNYRIRKVLNGIISTVAGNGVSGYSGDNGPAASAQMSDPQGLAVDSAGSLYVADEGNNCIRKISNGVITTVAGNGAPGSRGDGGPATSAELFFPFGVAVDSFGNLYIADAFSFRIREVSNGVISTIAGTGQSGFSGDNGLAINAQLNSAESVAVDSAANVYIGDNLNYRVRKVSKGVISTVAGNGAPGFSGDGGPATTAQLAFPDGVALDTAGNLYISDFSDQRVRKVSKGVITTIAEIPNPEGLAVDSAGNLFVAAGSLIYKITNGVITAVAGGAECSCRAAPSATAARLPALC